MHNIATGNCDRVSNYPKLLVLSLTWYVVLPSSNPGILRLGSDRVRLDSSLSAFPGALIGDISTPILLLTFNG